ncbi:MAG: DUF1059 domain-containing protein [Armatimonadetes bacterium]|nr:DUF1059 domain-containing protein [Armatimonadota bacterium]
MKKINCPCGFEAKTHTADELVKITQLHVQEVHKQDHPQGLPREQILQMITDA